jgi:hypothetical protein
MSTTASPPSGPDAADGGPKPRTAHIAEATGRRARLGDAARLLAGEGGTTIAPAGAALEARSP